MRAPATSLAVSIDFHSVAYPPLINKWGGVAHPHAIHGGTGAKDPAWDNITNETLWELTDDMKRRTPVVLGVVELGHTMSNVTRPIFRGDASAGTVEPILDPLRLELRQRRGSANGVQPMLQFSGCPTPVFRVNASTVPSPHARFYPMCEYNQLDLLAHSFAQYARALHKQDGLASSWSFWAEPAHTVSATSCRQDKLKNIARYLDFYERVAPAIRSLVLDDVIAGWQLNAANGKADELSESLHPQDIFYQATQQFLEREARRGHIPIDYFTIQNYQGERSASIAANARAALCATLDYDRSASYTYSYSYDPAPVACSLRFALTPLYFVRFSEHKDVDPDFTRKSGTSELLDELALTADLPDVAYVAHSSWEDFFSGNSSRVAPMLTAALEFYRSLPTFRVPITVPSTAEAPRRAGRQDSESTVRGIAAFNDSTQCFLLWSRTNAAQQVDVALDLLSRPPASAPQVVQLYTLGPRHASWMLERSAPLPAAPKTSLTILGVEFKPYGVVAACVQRSKEAARPTMGAGSLGGALYARHDVLVPRGSTAQTVPMGLGHYDVWNSVLIVGIDATSTATTGEAVGLAGVVLRAVPTDRSFALSAAFALQRAGSQNVTNVALRVDYLNESSPMYSLEFSSAPHRSSTMWGGAAAAWPRAAENLTTSLLPPFDASARTTLKLMLASQAPRGWADADSGARRVRISLIARPAQGAAATSSAATLRVVLQHEMN